MGSISSLNPGITNLLQTLSDVNSPVLSSPSAVSALEQASPSDLVQLSTAAMQLENVDAMFGMPDASSSNSNAALNNLLTTLETPQTTTPSVATAQPAASTTASPAEQAANYEQALQQAEAQTLLGLGSTGTSGSLFDLLA